MPPMHLLSPQPVFESIGGYGHPNIDCYSLHIPRDITLKPIMAVQTFLSSQCILTCPLCWVFGPAAFHLMLQILMFGVTTFLPPPNKIIACPKRTPTFAPMPLAYQFINHLQPDALIAFFSDGLNKRYPDPLTVPTLHCICNVTISNGEILIRAACEIHLKQPSAHLWATGLLPPMIWYWR